VTDDRGSDSATADSVPGRALPRLDLLRELSDQSVLDVVFAAAPVTRAEIARRTGISKPTVNEAVRRLERVGLLRPAGTETGRPGRVATYYEVAADAGFVVGVDLNPTAVRICATDLFRREFHTETMPPLRARSPRDVAQQLRTGVRAALEAGRRDHGELLALGVSVANPVDPATGAVIALPDTPYPEGLIQPAEVLADLVSAPLLVDNDVNLAAIAEMEYGVGREVASFAYLFVGAGIGAGLVVDGTLLRGARGLAGEIGYLSMGFGSPEEHSRHGLARAVAAQDFAGTARAIGEAAAALCAVLDPQLVVLGGPIGLQPALLEPVQRAVDALAPVPTPVRTGTVGEAAPLQGALVVALERARADLWAGSQRGGPSTA
jgi:predicted NBD/HSP70 family sugar kinase